MKINLSTILDLLGLACLLVAGFALDWRLGTACAGTGALLASWRLDDDPVDEPAQEHAS